MKRSPKQTTIHLTWVDCMKSARYESSRWAATDRGWLYAHVDASAVTPQHDCTLGHYLDCAGLESYAGKDKTVHAVSCANGTSDHFATVAEAKAWIESEASGRVAQFMASRYRAVGGYEHRALQIERFRVAS
jgi:hypothetical protein